MLNNKSLIKKIINKSSGFIWQHALLGRRRTLRILTYHGVVEKYQDKFLERNFVTREDFIRQLDFLQKKFKFISIPQIVEANRQFSNEIAITFDDGYENNIAAADILTERNIPFTIFLTTGLLGKVGRGIWPVDLELLLLKGGLTEICLLNEIWYLENDEQRRVAYKRIKQLFKALNSTAKDKLMQELSNLYPVYELEELHAKFNSFNMLSVEQAVNLSMNPLCNLGCHGYLHELLHPNQDESVVASEIVKSKEQFKLYFGFEPEYFGYPNGDYSTASEKYLKNAGFKAAFLNSPTPLININNRFEFPRLNIPNNFNVFKSQVNHY